MAKQNPLQHILDKPLSRKEFLQHIGVLLLAVFGISRVMQQLLHHDTKIAHKPASRGWGGGKFGA